MSELLPWCILWVALWEASRRPSLSIVLFVVFMCLVLP